MAEETATRLHRDAMAEADLALAARLRGDADDTLVHARAAFDLEARALVALGPGPGSEPTRSVLSRSAATLALDCGLVSEAGRLAREALESGPPHWLATELTEVVARSEARLDPAR